MAASSACASSAPAGDSCWKRYDKIPLSTQNFGAVASSSTWVVTEKVHGANFSVICAASGDVNFAKRSRVLPPKEDFYSFRSQRLDVQLTACARRLIVALRSADTSITSACVYGELFGGSYPHSDVAELPGLQPVQHGVWYSPSLCFIGFDLLVARQGRIATYLDFSHAAAACEAAGFMFVRPLARGSLEHCLAYGERFESTVPQHLGLPLLAGSNLAEGVVIRPEVEMGRRQLFKQKIAEFGETQYSNNDWKKSREGGTHCHADQALFLQYEIEARVTEQRLASVLSKTGHICPTDKGACRQLLHDLKQDVLDALVDEEVLDAASSSRPLDFESEQVLDQAARILITKYVKQLCSRPM